MPREASALSQVGQVDEPEQKSNQAFEVRKIVGERNTATEGKLYLVRWKGWKKEDDTWEPAVNLEGCQQALLKWRQKKLANQEKAAAKLLRKATESKTNSKSNIRKRSRSDSSGNSDYSSSKRLANNSADEPLKKLQINGSSEPELDEESQGPPKVDLTQYHPDRLKFLAKLRTLKGPEITLVNHVDSVPCPPLEFNFVNDYIYREGVPEPDPEFNWGCECKGAFGCATTRASDCACGRENHEELPRLAYKHKGLLRYPQQSSWAIHECNEKCKCNWRCSNTVVLKGRQIPLEIFKTDTKGWGVRSKIDLEAGQFIDRYVGEVITEAEAERRTSVQESRGLTYLFDLDKFVEENNEETKVYCVDGADFGGVARFINHSCEPNMLSHAVTHNRSRLDIYDLALFTSRKIRAGEELTFEYVRQDPDEEITEERKKSPCYCGAKKCRGWLW